MRCTEFLNVLLSRLKCCYYGIAIVIDNCLVPLIVGVYKQWNGLLEWYIFGFYIFLGGLINSY